MSAGATVRHRTVITAGVSALLAALVTSVSWTVAPVSPAAAAGCSASDIAVVVDFTGLGGSVQTGCTRGDAGSGVEALQEAGFTPSRAQAERSGYFVCRINGKPATDPCVKAAPTTASWSYWTASPGGTWRYSTRGASASDPAPGSVEGWAFGGGRQPSIRPPATIRAAAVAPPAAAPAAKPPAAPAAKPPAAPAAKPPAAAETPAERPDRVAPRSVEPRRVDDEAQPRETAPRRPSATTGGAEKPATGRADTPAASPTTGGVTPTVAATSAAAQPTADGETVAPEPSDDDTSRTIDAAPAAATTGAPSTALIGGAVVLLVAAGAGWQLRSRRRTSHD